MSSRRRVGNAQRRHLKPLLALIEDAGLEHEISTTGSGHIRLDVISPQRSRFMIMANTASDRRNQNNTMAQCRRLISELNQQVLQ
jgi:hypothetical protein